MADVTWPEPPTRVLWSRGRGCSVLAEHLDPDAQRVDGNTESACIEQRATLLVRRRLSARFDLVPVAVPHDVDFERAETVIALVGGGPHSALAAAVTARLAERLDVPGRMLCAYRTDGEQAEALTIVERLFKAQPTLEFQTIRAEAAAEIVESIGDADLAVLGAAAGSWLQRQFFGTGARLLSAVPAGAIVVRDAPERVFQQMEEPAYVSPLMLARDALLVFAETRLPVVENSTLAGVVTREALQAAGPQATVGDVMIETEALKQEDALPDPSVLDVLMPVVDDDGRLVGLLRPPTLP